LFYGTEKLLSISFETANKSFEKLLESNFLAFEPEDQVSLMIVQSLHDGVWEQADVYSY
jgi:hypothetical protein